LRHCGEPCPSKHLHRERIGRVEEVQIGKKAVVVQLHPFQPRESILRAPVRVRGAAGRVINIDVDSLVGEVNGKTVKVHQIGERILRGKKHEPAACSGIGRTGRA
jgi:hypothetical protein